MVRRVRSVERRQQQPDFGEKLGTTTVAVESFRLIPSMVFAHLPGESHLCG